MYKVGLDGLAALAELDGEAFLQVNAPGEANLVRTIHEGGGNGLDGVALVLKQVLHGVCNLHLKELVAEDGLLVGREGIFLVISVHGKADGGAHGLEVEGIAHVAGRHKLAVGGVELAVEEAVGQVVHGLCRPGCIEGAIAVFALVGEQVIYALGGGAALDVACLKGHGDLLGGVLSVDDYLVACLPGRL